jgi:hypothetical protein
MYRNAQSWPAEITPIGDFGLRGVKSLHITVSFRQSAGLERWHVDSEWQKNQQLENQDSLRRPGDAAR